MLSFFRADSPDRLNPDTFGGTMDESDETAADDLGPYVVCARRELAEEVRLCRIRKLFRQQEEEDHAAIRAEALRQSVAPGTESSQRRGIDRGAPKARCRRQRKVFARL